MFSRKLRWEHHTWSENLRKSGRKRDLFWFFLFFFFIVIEILTSLSLWLFLNSVSEANLKIGERKGEWSERLRCQRLLVVLRLMYVGKDSRWEISALQRLRTNIQNLPFIFFFHLILKIEFFFFFLVNNFENRVWISKKWRMQQREMNGKIPL